METSLEERIEELLHRLRIEAAVVAGAKNVIRILQNNKVPDKKALQEVSDKFSFNSFDFACMCVLVHKPLFFARIHTHTHTRNTPHIKIPKPSQFVDDR